MITQERSTYMAAQVTIRALFTVSTSGAQVLGRLRFNKGSEDAGGCAGPIFVDNTLTAYGVLQRMKWRMHKHLNTAFQLMAFFNSSGRISYCGGWWICDLERGHRAPSKRHPSFSEITTTSVRWI
uniref:uncharacterized protein LOC117610598 isoform X1 n=1 Tax=Osmia lignaria TaxID=473952 RepID=UPI00147949C2|nr:uncharacterized protein LOC117610598 isoform X1 [Osmia lignaria]